MGIQRPAREGEDFTMATYESLGLFHLGKREEMETKRLLEGTPARDQKSQSSGNILVNSDIKKTMPNDLG